MEKLPRPEPFKAPPKPTNRTHVYVGQYRPTPEEILQIEQQCILDGVQYCPMGHKCKYASSWHFQLRRCWKQGCYDTPAYVPIHDLLKPIHDALIEMLKKAETISKGGLPGVK